MISSFLADILYFIQTHVWALGLTEPNELPSASLTVYAKENTKHHIPVRRTLTGKTISDKNFKTRAEHNFSKTLFGFLQRTVVVRSVCIVLLSILVYLSPTVSQK